MPDVDPNNVIGWAGKYPEWYKRDLAKQPKSLTHTETELKILGSEETLRVPVLSSTLVWDLKVILATRLAINPGKLVFVTKQGCTYRTQSDFEEVRRTVVVKGIKSFKRAKHQWSAPLTVIGAGHMGLRLGLYFLKHEEHNFVIYDRNAVVGGTSWLHQANETSKLQTELGTYHLQYDPDNPVPTNMTSWPSRDDLLKHFAEVAGEYGLMPYCKMCVDVTMMRIEKGSQQDQKAEMYMMGRNWASQNYKLTLKETGVADAEETEVDASAVFYFPGNLTIPRRFAYKNEEDFGGPIAYAICNDFDYDEVTGREVVIVGHGAFAVENVRTCAEYSAKKMYMVCRRKNMACPRVASWLINQSANALSGALYMKAMQPMYDLVGWDHWSYYAVHSNEKRTNVTLIQKARFGIGDTYFLALAMGYLEVVVDDIKRLSQHCVHLISGRKLENIHALLKLYGFDGNFEVDRLLNMKALTGFWSDFDFRRFIFAEPIGVDASNFSATTFSPGAIVWAEYASHFAWYPSDFADIAASGQLPSHEAEPEKGRPAYVMDARMSTTSTFVLLGMVPAFQETSARNALLKRRKQLECHPMDRFVEECAVEWEEYAHKWKALGAPGAIPAYPYTPTLVQELLDAEQLEINTARAKQQALAQK